MIQNLFRASVLGCADKMTLDSEKEEEWVPRDTFKLATDSTRDVKYAVVFVKMASAGSADDIAIVRWRTLLMSNN